MVKYKKWIRICLIYGLMGIIVMLPVKYYFLSSIVDVLYASSDIEHAKIIHQLHNYATFGLDVIGVLLFDLIGVCIELIKMSTSKNGLPSRGRV